MTSGNKTNWNVFGKKRKDSDEVQSRKWQFISYPAQAHFAYSYSYSTLQIRLNYYGFHNSCNLR